MRLIDADEPLSRLSMFSDKENGDEHFLNGIDTAKEIIDSTPTISPAANWTPCSVALPEDEIGFKPMSRYECTIQLADGSRETFSFQRGCKQWYYESNGSMLMPMSEEKVIAWRKRTEPYRGDA